MADVHSFSFLLQRRTFFRVMAVATAFAVAGLVGAFLAPKWYRSTLTVVPARVPKSGGLSALLGGELAGFAAGLADGALGGGADVQRISAVLHSDDVTDAVIAKFDLKHRYDEDYQESAREALWKHCDVRALPKPGLVQLSCEDKEPLFVKEVLEYFADYGNRVFRRVGVSSATEQVRFLEKRTAELRAQADETASRMRAFQETHQIVDLESQAKAVVNAMASLNGQRISKQLELDFARTFSSQEEASLQQLESQLGVVDRRLKSMEDDAAARGGAAADGAGTGAQRRAGTGLFPAALAVPRLRAEFEKLYRDRKVAEATLIYSLQQLESAKADEARETSTFLVLDPPTVPTRKSRPHRAVIALLVGILGLIGAAGVEWWRAGGSAVIRHAIMNGHVIRRPEEP